LSYQTEAALATDPDFQARVKACTTAQANVFKDDDRPDIAGLAHAMLRNDIAPLTTFWNLIAAAPGFGDSVDSGDGTIDQSAVTDPDLLAAVQAAWPTVADLYYSDTGVPTT
jgi:hypothetical protein